MTAVSVRAAPDMFKPSPKSRPTAAPLCTICQPPRRHSLREGHVFEKPPRRAEMVRAAPASAAKPRRPRPPAPPDAGAPVAPAPRPRGKPPAAANVKEPA